MQKENADSNIVSQEKSNVFSWSSKYNVDKKLDMKKEKCIGVDHIELMDFTFYLRGNRNLFKNLVFK